MNLQTIKVAVYFQTGLLPQIEWEITLCSLRPNTQPMYLEIIRLKTVSILLRRYIFYRETPRGHEDEDLQGYYKFIRKQRY